MRLIVITVVITITIVVIVIIIVIIRIERVHTLEESCNGQFQRIDSTQRCLHSHNDVFMYVSEQESRINEIEATT